MGVINSPRYIRRRANGTFTIDDVGRIKDEKLEDLKKETKRIFDARVYIMADKLLNSQAVAALGMYKMITQKLNPVTGILETKTIHDEKVMQKLFDTGKHGVDYFIVAGAEPDWKAANALLDRSYGKAKESIDVGIEVKFSLKDLAAKRKKMREDEKTMKELPRGKK